MQFTDISYQVTHRLWNKNIKFIIYATNISNFAKIFLSLVSFNAAHTNFPIFLGLWRSCGDMNWIAKLGLREEALTEISRIFFLDGSLLQLDGQCDVLLQSSIYYLE
jgi:hypothetical protein